MPLSASAGKALGKLWRNLRNPRWYAEQTGQWGASAAQLTVLNWAGKRVDAAFKGKIVHQPDEKSGEVHLGDVYHCADGHNYVRANGKTYRYDANTDTWYEA